MKEKDVNRELSRKVERKEKRKLRARQESRELWFGLGMFGVVGWSVALPTLLGILLGIWLDNRLEGPVSWTLTCFFLGLCLGCFSAWYWMNREGQLKQEDEEDELEESDRD